MTTLLKYAHGLAFTYWYLFFKSMRTNCCQYHTFLWQASFKAYKPVHLSFLQHAHSRGLNICTTRFINIESSSTGGSCTFIITAAFSLNVLLNIPKCLTLQGRGGGVTLAEIIYAYKFLKIVKLTI